METIVFDMQYCQNNINILVLGILEIGEKWILERERERESDPKNHAN